MTFLSLFWKFRKGYTKPDQESRRLSSNGIGNNLRANGDAGIGLRINTTTDSITVAREELKRLTLERDIVTMGLKSVYEAETKGAISKRTKDQMTEKLKADLKGLDQEISGRRRLTEAFDLRIEREQLTGRLKEIDERLKQCELVGPPIGIPDCSTPGSVLGDKQTGSPTKENLAEKQIEDRARARPKVEDRIDAIRADVLQAMERLERMDAEG